MYILEIVVFLLMLSAGVFLGSASIYNNLTVESVKRAARTTMWISGLSTVVLCAIIVIIFLN